MTATSPATLLSRRFPAKRAFVTGAASGLGLAIAECLARDGWTLGLLDLSAARLEGAAARLRQAGAREVAGVAGAGAVELTPVEDWRWIVDINLLGVVWGCRAALPALKRQGAGLVLNVASSAGFAAAPQMAAYNVTKAGVIALSETLVTEL